MEYVNDIMLGLYEQSTRVFYQMELKLIIFSCHPRQSQKGDGCHDIIKASGSISQSWNMSIILCGVYEQSKNNICLVLIHSNT